ncbi:MAG: hypothetical protein AB7G23_12565 [Vicinamibacterales bacterium]
MIGLCVGELDMAGLLAFLPARIVYRMFSRSHADLRVPAPCRT